MIHGPAGDVTQLIFHAGATITVNTASNSTVKASVWTSASHTNSTVMCAYARFGNGKVAAIGDSSPCDDGTGDPNDNLYFGWTDASGNHGKLFTNASVWLATSQALPVPIQLAYLRAQVIANSNDVRMEWRTLSETNNYGFVVQTRDNNAELFIDVPNSFVPGHGTTLVPENYEFVQANVSPGIHQYRLKQIDLDGTNHFTDVVDVVLTGLTTAGEGEFPEKFSLSQNSPNPFNPSTVFKFGLANTGFVRLIVLDLLGRKVATLVNEELRPGSHERVFSAKGGSASGGN